ncbi:MAG: hypothetical protein K0S26_1090 [Bacteroidota bacterium]|jgi:hypothetical protein|nr:hypothetical protein [Bacteroidota bacterium]
MTTLKDIISKYRKDLQSLKKKQTDLEIVFNSDWDTIDDNLKIIYCGDNPGKKEKDLKKYFIGNAGNKLTLFISTNNARLGIESNQFAFFNKSSFHSIKTSDITKEKDCDKSVYKSIELTVECLFQIWNIKQIPIIVFGIDEKTYIVKSFKEIILKNKYSEFSKNLTILNHPSNNSLFGEFGKFLIKALKDNDRIEIEYENLINAVKKNWL